jgi:CDP-6-deoxy-D-xylo-4-hexulose-3-dehydrase
MINGRMVGRRGIMSTLSFYPAHHITTGEGGMVLTDYPKLGAQKGLLRCLRDWGRACWCEPGMDNTCGTRFQGDYDHKYSYSHVGYNLKSSDLQAAVGVAQMEKIDRFILARRRNWAYLRESVDDLPINIIDPSPDSSPSWFGFAFLTERRNELQKYLELRGIGCRPIMGGNITRQKMMQGIEYEVIGSLDGADQIHEQGIWVGCYHGLTLTDMDEIGEALREFF